jgi:hypothetical protein
MLKRALPTILFASVLTLGASSSAKAGDIIQTLPDFGSTDSYDFDTTFPTPGVSTTVGTYTFTIPTGNFVTGITISGFFGSELYGVNTALSDYYLGYAGDETAVEVANCDSASLNCYSGQEGPYAWGPVTLTQAQIADLAPALANGSLDFTYTWDSTTPPISFGSGYLDQYVNVGPATIDISTAPTPEPATVLFCFSGLAALAAVRRFRKI